MHPASYLPERNALGDTFQFPPDVKPNRPWLILIASICLVAVPVFVQAPLVRLFPWISLAVTSVFLFAGVRLMARPLTHGWGDLLFGFGLTWLSGSLYWGWLRWEPLWHLPVESIGLPFALWALMRGWGKIGNLFYLGSLFGTAVTDIYFYLVDLMPYWRQLMRVDANDVGPIFHSALVQMQTPWGAGWAIALACLLLVIGAWPLCSRHPYWWAFSGAVLSTILVDSLFWLAAAAA